MGKKTTYIHAENNNKILSSNEVRLYVPPEPEKMKVLIWGKELCNVAEWNDFLKCVEEKTEENNQLKQQLAEAEEYIENDEVTKREYYQKTDEIIAEKDKEIERLKNLFELNNEVVINQGKEIFDLRVQVLQQKQNQKQLAIQELENAKMMTEWKFRSIVEVVDYLDNQIKELKGE